MKCRPPLLGESHPKYGPEIFSVDSPSRWMARRGPTPVDVGDEICRVRDSDPSVKVHITLADGCGASPVHIASDVVSIGHSNSAVSIHIATVRSDDKRVRRNARREQILTTVHQ